MVGLKLKRLRECRGISREEMADRLNMERSTYGRYESGETKPTVDRLHEFAAALNVAVEELVSPDPIVLTIHQAHGTQVGNGYNVRFTQHVVSEDFVKDVMVRIDRVIDQQNTLNEKLIALLDKVMSGR
jgi:transcriptional regulator with XRE-family HTH domain